jgi:hypothetical protein
VLYVADGWLLQLAIVAGAAPQSARQDLQP